MPGIVASDEFTRKKKDAPLPLVWQWNHNPDNANWSVTARPGYLRLTTGRVDTSLMLVRNMLTQRTFGPTSTGSTAVDVSNMKDGDCAGLILLQGKYGWVGVKMENGFKSIVMVNAGSGKPVEIERIPVSQNNVYLKAECDFRNRTDKGYFYYSLDGEKWIKIGDVLEMKYTLDHFMGYRFGLFNWATTKTGGWVDWDWFRVRE